MQPGGRYVAINIPLRMLIMRAYRLLEFRLSGGPAWINTERYDIVGLAPGATNSDEITPRLQSLLAERFKLAAHMEKKEVSVLWLVRADKDGRLGPKFHTSTAGCPPLSPATCVHNEAHVIFSGDGRLTYDCLCKRAFAAHTGRIVVDRTGLTGLFEADLRWTPDQPAECVLPHPAVPRPRPLTTRTDHRSQPHCSSNWVSSWRAERNSWICWSSTGLNTQRRTDLQRATLSSRGRFS